MKRYFRIIAMILALVMCSSIALPAVAVESENEPLVTVMLVPGGSTEARGEIETEDGIIIKFVNAQTTPIETIVNSVVSTGFNGPKPYLKFDRNSTADQKAKQKIHDLYTDNGHFHDPSTITVTNAPESYPFQFVGYGDYSGHYVSKVRVIYDRYDDGTLKKDADGNFIIKRLEHSNGTPLTFKGEPTLNINGPFDQTTGTRPQHFLLMNEAGETVYAYCIDLGTGVASGNPFYSVANLEDAGYYASEEAERHIRAITQNGYWGTESGMGSTAQLKEAIKAAIASGKIEKEYDITFVIRIKKQNTVASDYVLKEDEYFANGYLCRTESKHIVLTDDVVDQLTCGEAIDAMQCAIWSFANGSNYALDGTDRMIVGDVTYASCALGDSRNAQNDFAGAARTKALYNYLISLETDERSTVVINEKNFIKNMSLTVGNHLGNGMYSASINFETYFNANVEKDDLAITLTYVDANGVIQTITRKLTGKDAITPDDNGFYTLDGLKLRAGQEFNFNMNVTGAQFLEQNTYIFTAQYGIDQSQTMVGVASGTNTVDVDASFSAIFEVEERQVAPTAVVFEGVKFLDGLRASGFEFVLEGENGIIETVTSGKNGAYAFSELIYNLPGTYEYVVYEKAGDDKSIVYDDREYSITVDVERIGDELVANVYIEKDGLDYRGDAGDLDFRNYKVRPCDITISGEKYLDGQLAGGFDFALEDENGNIIETSSNANGYFEFRLDYAEAGVYSYNVYEIAGNDDGIIYDSVVYEVEVVVTLEGKQLVATSTGASNIEFNNETIPEETTTPPEETTTPPEETTTPPEETTTPPEETTTPPEETTTPPEETTTPPEETTEPPVETTEPEPETTEPEPETTEPEPETTEPEPETTEPEPETTEPEPETTAPETEEITEENPPLDPTPDSTEPVDTEEIPEDSVPLTDAPTTTEPSESGKTGDNSVFFIAAAFVAIISLAVVATKKQNVED